MASLNKESAAARKRDHFFVFIRQEFIDRASRAGASCETIVVADDDPAIVHARIEELNAVSGWLIQIYIYMHKRESSVCHIGKSLRYPTFVPADIVKFLQIMFHHIERAGEIAFRPVGAIYRVRIRYSFE